MKKRLAAVLIVLFALLATSALAYYELTADDYDLYYEIVDFLCDDWVTPYDDLIYELSVYYDTHPDDIYDFIDYAIENDRDHVWIPVNGGQKFHCNPFCSNMIEPRPCTWDLAVDFGFSRCARCKP